MKKKLITILLCLPLITGCWDKEELNNRAIVLETGIDRDPTTEEFISSYQVVRPESLREDSGSSKSSPTELITVRGKSLAEARQNLMKKFDRSPFFAHNKTIIVSERLAKSGLQPVLDRLARSNEIRPLNWIIIAKGATPEDIMSVNRGISQIQAVYLNDIITWRKNHSEANVNYIQEFVEEMLSDNPNPTAGVIEITVGSAAAANNEVSTTKELKLTGTSVFKKDILVGYLSAKETKGLNWITGKIKTGVITFSSPTKDNKIITTLIKKVKSSINPEKKDGKYIFNIKITETSEISEQHDLSDISDPKAIELMEREQDKAIEKQIETTIDKAQNELKVDFLGFGSALSKKYPKEWEEIKNDWENIFPSVQYTITVDSRIVRTGLLLKPLKTSD